MDRAIVDQIVSLVDEASQMDAADRERASFDGELAEAAVWAGKSLLAAGALDQAQHLWLSAAAFADGVTRRELAAQLTSLAKAWSRSQQTDDSAANAENALRAAVELDPDHATTALAQFLGTRGPGDEAVRGWREALRRNPREASNYLALADLYEARDETEQAYETYAALVDAVPTRGNYLLVAERLDGLAQGLAAVRQRPTIKIALLGNATLHHLAQYVRVEAYRAGMQPEVYQCGFDQYMQDIANPMSPLYEFGPDVLICAIHASRLFPAIHRYPPGCSPQGRRDSIEQGLGTIRSLLDVFTERSPAVVLLHNMVSPQHPALGIADLRDESGQTALFSEINLRMAELARTRYRNVYVVDEDRVQARTGKAKATDQRLWLAAGSPWSDDVLLGLAREYLRYLRPLKGLGKKCIVVDLDNTLWGGVVGEDGVSGIRLGHDAAGNAFVAFQRELERLWERGILLAICSKNNPEDAYTVFEQHPDMVLKRTHFAAQRINWEPKATNIRAIAKELNIGLDSLVFLDDSPVERTLVRAELPQVFTPELPSDPAYYRSTLLELGVFDTLALTEEDLKRNQLYVEQAARQELEATYESAGRRVQEYLEDLDINVEFAPVDDFTLPRIAQLTTKTNQLNLTTRRYSEAQISAMKAEGWNVYGIRVVDRFGDYGLVGVAIAAPRSADVWELDTMLLSCRVMGRGVETALVAFLVDQVRQEGAQRFEGWYLPTASNAPVASFYQEHGFSLIERRADSGDELWALDITEAQVSSPSWLKVRGLEPAAV